MGHEAVAAKTDAIWDAHVTAQKEGRATKKNNTPGLGDSDQWLGVLTSALKNQDPTGAMKMKDILGPLTHLAQASGLGGLKTAVERMTQVTNVGHMLNASNQLERMVEVKNNQFHYTKEDPCLIAFNLPLNSKKASLIIMNEKNEQVSVLDVNAKPGRNLFAWDGKKNNGEEVKSGIYKAVISPLDADGKVIEDSTGRPRQLDVSIVGRVKGVRMKGGEAFVNVANADIPLTAIVASQSPESFKQAFQEALKRENPDAALPNAPANAQAQVPAQGNGRAIQQVAHPVNQNANVARNIERDQMDAAQVLLQQEVKD